MDRASQGVDPHPLLLRTVDGLALAAHHWPVALDRPRAVVVVNPATAVKAAYYHRFARFLAGHGMAVLTYDYRGIGDSRHGKLRHHRGISKLDWGRFDCDAALAWARENYPDVPLHVVAHSIGGLLVGLARNNRHIARCLTVGSQYAYWPDYAKGQRLVMWLRWHLLMPLLTLLLGYFPARRLGWHEDLPAAAAYEWAFRPARLEKAYGSRYGAGALAHFDTMAGDILALGISDDPFGTPAAIRRLLDYFRRSRRIQASITPASVGEEKIGHFAFFHERFRPTLWEDARQWLARGCIPGEDYETRPPDI
ncbi:MAG: alpha/beta fold hydrolase [Rhodocyclaceae bacterium]|nr:MAG: alpha/beta fold hydrolase [Rhodocyclaceae bacterium]